MIYLKNDTEINQQLFFDKLKTSKLSPKKYYQTAMGFDIETSSFIDSNNEKRGTMYIWQICFLLPDDTVPFYCYGRTWDEWEDFIRLLRKEMSITTKQKFIIYVHNLAFEYQWIYTHIFFNKVFARKSRHPMYAESKGLIFKCSYFLSNYSLRNLAKTRGYTLKEVMNYSLKRLSCTPLKEKEIKYSLVDVKIIAEYIKDEIKRNEYIENIPLTSTGYARRYCIEFISERTNFISYNNRIRNLLPKTEELFFLLYDAYAGGFTHSNYIHTGITLENVHCVDYTSSYPAVMCRKRFPMKFRWADPTLFKSSIYDGMAKLMKINYTNIRAKTPHSIISSHKCSNMTKEVIDNGRVREASTLTTTITDLDFDLINKFYDYDEYQIETLYVAEYKYLPRLLVLAILELYKDKTTLKGVIGKEEPYLRSKELINSVYGMSVTNPINDEIEFNYAIGEWDKIPTDIDAGLNKYNTSKKTFTAYQWGVWVTAWARYELLSTVYKIGDDVVYCDTDSIKYLNEHDDIISADNERIMKENAEIQEYYQIPAEYYSPVTEKGEIKPLGVWDRDPDYQYFKTLGAKRYVYSYNEKYFNKKKREMKVHNNFFITVAGLPKDKGRLVMLSLARIYKQSPFDIFDYENSKISDNYALTFDKKRSGKQIFSYQNDTFWSEETDYLGNTCEVYETSYVYVEPTEFTLGITEEYMTLLSSVIHVGTKMGGTFTDPRKE